MSATLDVLHVIDQVHPGGAERNLLAMVRELKAHGIRSHVAWLFGRGGLEEEFARHAATMIPLELRQRWQLPQAILKLAHKARSLAPAVVHGQLLVSHLAARAVGRALNRPVVTTWQNTVYEDQALRDFGDSRRLRALFRGADWLSSARGAHYVACSEHVRDHWMRSVGVSRTQVHVIYNVVEPERCRPVDAAELGALRARLALDPHDEIIISAGRLVAGKGHGEAIAAMPQIVLARPRARLLIAGTGPEEMELRATIAAYGLTGRVQLIGFQDEMAPVYALGSLFLFATHTEGLPLTLGEALAAGLPAAISAIGPNREVAGDLSSVRYFPVGDSEAMAHAVIELLAAGDKARSAARAAQAEIRRRFDPAHLAQQLADVLVAAARTS